MIVELIEDNNELVIPFPAEFIKELGWKEGDTLTWIDNEDGTFTIKKTLGAPREV